MAELLLQTREVPFRKGVQAGVSIAIGYAPVALTFGLLAKTTGLSFIETVLMSMIVFAGASQYMALSLISLGTSTFEIIFTTFIVNIRHFLMSTALNEKAEDDRLMKKALYSFGITDESFSVIATKDGVQKTGFILGVNIIGYMSWVTFTALGFVVGANLPQVLQESMTVALYAMFIGLLVPSMKGSAKVVYLAAIAAGLNTIFTFTGALSTGWSIVIATLISSVLVEVIEGMKREDRQNEQ
ncbi:AzlC family ABC transporter permease [Cytobacillus sp. FSL W7-1323]|uniref:Branched-chain amino acid ABC transporter permease n=1 Tax=Cytobacillus kochii TaxID=859143 RepID=A0A248TDW0_9BACI|nr:MULTISPECIES: AzlC family ABC transporter permease [Cytobacillus]ASV66290.1 branched-chain amino acid ABC transporter permease [Cytobacillus kochii]MDQ0187071.1 4-azaleucine resistance transporter AzlC [Cytobacillus kochii]MEA1851595.1 AzlC family ABC transporter permease [Cytobacillus sp. OWB-43]MED1605664.1 AzlC family ABC transporter permease [Cytobacillus kochii]